MSRPANLQKIVSSCRDRIDVRFSRSDLVAWLLSATFAVVYLAFVHGCMPHDIRRFRVLCDVAKQGDETAMVALLAEPYVEVGPDPRGVGTSVAKMRYACRTVCVATPSHARGGPPRTPTP